MKEIWQIIKIGLLTLYIAGVFLLIFKNDFLVEIYNLPNWLIPLLCILSVFYFWFKYLSFYLNISKLENEFISIANHTFRTPLTGILWATKELDKDISQKERAIYIENISKSTNRIVEVVDILVGIKTINNIATYNFQALSIRTIVENSIIKYKNEIIKRGLNFQVSTFKDVPLLTNDLKKISFVFDTIIENAIFYTPKNGKILIDFISNHEKITIFISDNGIGLTFIEKIRIFSIFYRSKRALLLNPNSMGLRLYLSKQIIARHKGKIYAKSNGENKGATFFIELPFNK